MRTLVSSILLAATAWFGGMSAYAQDAFKAGEHYAELKPEVPVSVEPGKIEVVELFWYGCPHCYEFEPSLNPWVQKLPSDVVFRRLPALFGRLWDVHGQLFLTLEAMGVEPKVHEAIFAAMHQKGLKLATPEEMASFLAGQGIDSALFLKTFDSFAVKSRMEQTRKQVFSYKATGVPALIVNGKYRLDLGLAGGPERILQLADQLIEQERQAR